MPVPTLKLPDDELTDIRSIVANVEEYGFVGAYWACYYEADFKMFHDKKITHPHDTDELKRAQRICDTFNSKSYEMRRYIDQQMQEYLLTHDGIIEAWPYSQGRSTKYMDVPLGTYGISRALQTDFDFDYFGNDYEVIGSGASMVIRRKTPEKIYRNTYRFPGTREYNRQHDRETSLVRSIENTDSNVPGISGWLWKIGLVYFVCIILALVVDLLIPYSAPIYDFVKTLEAESVNMEISVGLVIKALFGVLMMPLAVHAPMVQGTDIPWLLYLMTGTLMLPFICGAAWTGYHVHKGHKIRQESIQLHKELDELQSSEEYQRICAENEKLRKENEALAEQWHRAWFQWAQKQER